MERQDIPPETLIIDMWFSRCNKCGGGAKPDERGHFTQLPGYSQEEVKDGCGVIWQYVSTSYINLIEDAKKLRPDLEYRGYEIDTAAFRHSA